MPAYTGIDLSRSRYGKVQSVRTECHTECMEAIVAFTDIKAASQAYTEDQMLGGAAPLSIAFCDGHGNNQSEARCPTLAATPRPASPAATINSARKRSERDSTSPIGDAW